MNYPNRLFSVLLVCISVLAGIGLGALFFQNASPVTADAPQNSGSSEGSIDSASADVYVPDEFAPRFVAASTTPTRTLYYFPVDSNNHNTLLFFHNTNSVTATIDLDFQSDSGNPCGSGVVFDIPPLHSARVSADSLDPGRPFSWANTIIYNMFDTCEIGLIKMPAGGVKVAGYVAWTANDTYNPRDQNPHASIRFSADPFTIFLPSVEANE